MQMSARCVFKDVRVVAAWRLLGIEGGVHCGLAA